MWDICMREAKTFWSFRSRYRNKSKTKEAKDWLFAKIFSAGIYESFGLEKEIRLVCNCQTGIAIRILCIIRFFYFEVDIAKVGERIKKEKNEPDRFKRVLFIRKSIVLRINKTLPLYNSARIFLYFNSSIYPLKNLLYTKNNGKTFQQTFSRYFFLQNLFSDQRFYKIKFCGNLI